MLIRSFLPALLSAFKRDVRRLPTRALTAGMCCGALALASCAAEEGTDPNQTGQAAGEGETDEAAAADDPPATEGTDASDDAEPATSTEPGAQDPPGTLPRDDTAPLVGSFLLVLQASEGNRQAVASFNGSVGDTPQPELTIWDLVGADEQMGCELLKPRYPACVAGCGEDACVEDDTCAPYPTLHSVGDITITGVRTTEGAAQMMITPQKPRLTYIKPASVTLEYPPAPEGAPITLTSVGGDYAPLSIELSAIAPLELASSGPLDLSGDAPFVLEWTPPARGESLIEVKVDISHHGGAKGKIECVTADDGSLTIPAELTRGLIDLGVAGFPTVEVTRVARGIGNVEPGRVEFQTISMTDRELLIPGLTSCKLDEDCPEEQVCLVTRSCG